MMGVHVNRRADAALAYSVAALIMAMNMFLIAQQIL